MTHPPHARRARRPRPALDRAAPAPAMLAVAMVTAVALGACTTRGAEPITAGTTAAAAQAGTAAEPEAGTTGPADVVPAVPDSGLTAVGPDPSMTPIEAAPRCTSTRPLTGKGRVPLEAVFPEAQTSGFSDPREVVPGPDAPDRSRCPAELPSEPRCDGVLPWTDLAPDAFVTASGARRLVQGYLLTVPKQAGKQSPPETSAGTKAITYSLVDLAPGDPGGLLDYLRAAFTTCAQASPRTVAGVEALVGTTRSDYRAVSAEVVLLRRGSHLVCASLDGSGWGSGEQERALAVLVTRLL